jgi:hypothetical protein
MAEPIQTADPPRKARAGNDLRNYLIQHRAASDGAAATSAPAPYHCARDPPPATPTLPGAPRSSALRRRAQDTPRVAEAIAPASTLVPRAPVPLPARPSSTPAAPGDPDTRAPSRSRRRKNRRFLTYAQLTFERLPAHPTMARTGAPSGAAPAVPPPAPPPLPGISPLPPHAPPAGDPPAAFPVGHPPPAVAPLPLATGEARPTTPPTPPAASPTARAHLSVPLGIADDEDPTALPDHPSPPPGAGEPHSDMDISPPAGSPPRASGRTAPPRLRSTQLPDAP